MNFNVRPATDADLDTIVEINAATTPESVWDADAMRHGEATFGPTFRLLAELDGRPVGAATIGRIYVLPAEYDGLWATLWVLEAHRRQGIGGRLLAALEDEARRRGKSALHVPVREDRAETAAFFAHRGSWSTIDFRTSASTLPGSRCPSPPCPRGSTSCRSAPVRTSPDPRTRPPSPPIPTSPRTTSR
jgi:[ribosomal protein S18]-alanine N-acetyltransferase